MGRLSAWGVHRPWLRLGLGLAMVAGSAPTSQCRALKKPPHSPLRNPQAMATVAADVGKLHPHLPELNLPDYAAAAAEQAVRAHAAAALATLGQAVEITVRRARAAAAAAGRSSGGGSPKRGGSGDGGTAGDRGEVPGVDAAALAAAFGAASDAVQRGSTAMLQVGAAGQPGAGAATLP
jgi:hypothetical protein